jgi:hypothetical protein
LKEKSHHPSPVDLCENYSGVYGIGKKSPEAKMKIAKFDECISKAREVADKPQRCVKVDTSDSSTSISSFGLNVSLVDVLLERLIWYVGVSLPQLFGSVYYFN